MRESGGRKMQQKGTVEVDDDPFKKGIVLGESVLCLDLLSGAAGRRDGNVAGGSARSVCLKEQRENEQSPTGRSFSVGG